MPPRRPGMTARQASYLRSLCGRTGEVFDPTLTKGQASTRIASLKRRPQQRATVDAPSGTTRLSTGTDLATNHTNKDHTMTSSIPTASGRLMSTAKALPPHGVEASRLALAVLIRERRRAAWLTKPDLVERSGVSRSALHQAETGRFVSAGKLASVLSSLAIRREEVSQVVGTEAWGRALLSHLDDQQRVVLHDRWLRAEDAAVELGVTPTDMAALKRAGLPHHRLPDSALCLFRASEMAAWRANHAWLPSEAPSPRQRRPRYRAVAAN
jgi:hypothetical protein